MAVFKCKMCGGSLEIQENTGIAVCEYCGSEQTIPRGDDDVRTNLFNRANNLRLKCEFDKAQQVYEKILNADNTDAEAHWGVVLCKYGIEYVEDPKTHKRIPTCHRTQYESVLTDVDYLAAIENADATQRGVYTTQALDISRLQKDILAIVEKEKPFDVFLCYKETDENGKRTVDSSLANDIYYQLTNEGLKVFYAAITLEDKLGQEYEPYIFAALHSAKVMLVIGTKPEYFEAVWVRNEWSRFLSIMKTDRSKLLIPCYRDMDAYDLPEEFSHLQAQDMSKIGFVNDVVRGIRKVVSGTTAQPAPTAVQTPAPTASNVSGLLERAFLFLEDGKWQEADSYCEKVLDQNPKCAEAYLGKLMAELQIKKRENLKDAAEPFDENDNCKKASRFDGNIADELAAVNASIRERNEQRRREDVYKKAESECKWGTEDGYKRAASLFMSISGFKDADERAKQCLDDAEMARKEKIYQTALRNSGSEAVSLIEQAAKDFESIADYKDARQKAEECRRRVKDLPKEKIYQEAIQLSEPITSTGLQKLATAFDSITISKLQKAAQLFDSIADYKDAREKAQECRQRIQDLPKEKAYQKALQSADSNDVSKLSEAAREFDSISDYRDSKEKAEECRKKAKELTREITYQKAIRLMCFDNVEKLQNAIELFESIEDYKDSRQKVREATQKIEVVRQKVQALETENTYRDAVNHSHSKTISQVELALEMFESLKDYKDSRQKAEECRQTIEQLRIQEERDREVFKKRAKIALIVVGILIALFVSWMIYKSVQQSKQYNQALVYEESGAYEEAVSIYEQLGSYKDSATRIQEAYYNQAAALEKAGKIDDAIAAFIKLGDYKDAKTKVNELYYQKAVDLEKKGNNIDAAILAFLKLGGYKDAKMKVNELRYQKASALEKSGNTDDAIAEYEKVGNYKDSKAKVNELHYQKASALEKSGNTDDAIAEYTKAGDYKDAKTKVNELRYQKASALGKSGNTDDAIAEYEKVGDYKDAKTKVNELNYQKAFALEKSGKTEEAIAEYEKLGDYKDAKAKVNELNYQNALALEKSGKTDEAIAEYEKLGDYKDSKTKINELNYNKAVALEEKGDYEQAAASFKALGDFKDASQKATIINNRLLFNKAEVGSTVFFGMFEQDNDKADGKEDVEWIVLEKQKDRVLIISKYALDCQMYNKEDKPITWETCTLRAWLNGDFLNEVFRASEQTMISTTAVKAERNPEYSTSPGKDTTDRVFLLSISEAEKYFASDEERRCAPTPYAISRGTWTDDWNKTVDGKDACNWWLRSPGSASDRAVCVSEIAFSCVHYPGWEVNSQLIGIRPAMWIKLA